MIGRAGLAAAFSGERASPDGGYRFRNLLETLELGAMQKLADVEQDDETTFELADPGNVAGLPFRKDRAWRLNLRRRNLQHFGSGVHNQADQLVFQLDNQDAVLLVVVNVGLAKELAKVHHRDDFAAEIDYTFDGVGSAGNRSDLRHAY